MSQIVCGVLTLALALGHIPMDGYGGGWATLYDGARLPRWQNPPAWARDRSYGEASRTATSAAVPKVRRVPAR